MIVEALDIRRSRVRAGGAGPAARGDAPARVLSGEGEACAASSDGRVSGTAFFARVIFFI
jgi:hypothetical protein